MNMGFPGFLLIPDGHPLGRSSAACTGARNTRIPILLAWLWASMTGFPMAASIPSSHRDVTSLIEDRTQTQSIAPGHFLANFQDQSGLFLFEGEIEDSVAKRKNMILRCISGGISNQGQLRLRLTSGPSPCSGRVEVLINDTWGAVCDAGWGLPEAGVVCKQLGCGTALSAPGVAQFGHGAGDVWLEGVSCSGQESLISECQLSRLGPGLCGRGSEARVVCAGQAGSGLLWSLLLSLGAIVVLICGVLLCWRMRRDRATGNPLGHVHLEELGAPGTPPRPQGEANPEPPEEPDSEMTRLVREDAVL
ncbi:uridine-cytidine kinase-like 1 [Platysternon megacephalum]|uniref:Uridine-cytidine kinase-like 1 n=1 Tax=Platysternon megacephalum TaxID=55544 RepID=A0A4D9DXK1_9SAUR|nr:uridine-cytidine kinase-like 1 [Platysternon megacephalum]